MLSNDPIYEFKEIAKRLLGPLYPYAIRIFSPVCPHNYLQGFFSKFDFDRSVVVDLGAGIK